MSTRGRNLRRVGVTLMVVAAAAGAAMSRATLDRLADAREVREDPLLYLPNGKHLRVASLGHHSLVADWIYIWAVQFYSDYERGDRFRYVEHVFGDVIAELDPQYVDPYWLGALIMTVEARDLEGGLRLLDKGFANNPKQWVLPYLAAWECYHFGQYDRAALYFERAAAVPGAPAHVRRMRIGALARAGQLPEALRMWTEVLEDPASDAATRAIAERQVRSIRIRLDLERLAAAVEGFRQTHGRLPARLSDLLRAGLLRVIPLDPDGNPYRYDPRSGEVSSAAGRMLGGGG